MEYYRGVFNQHCIKFDNYDYRNIVRSHINGTFITEEVSSWCNENLKDWEYHSIGGETIFYFDYTEDIIAFKLRWL